MFFFKGLGSSGWPAARRYICEFIYLFYLLCHTGNLRHYQIIVILYSVLLWFIPIYLIYCLLFYRYYYTHKYRLIVLPLFIVFCYLFSLVFFKYACKHLHTHTHHRITQSNSICSMTPTTAVVLFDYIHEYTHNTQKHIGQFCDATRRSLVSVYVVFCGVRCARITLYAPPRRSVIFYYINNYNNWYMKLHGSITIRK